MLRAPLGLLAPPHCYTLKEADVRGQPRLSLLKESDDTSIMQLLRMHGSELLAPMARGVEVSSLSIQLALAAKGVGVAVLSALGASHPSAQAMQFVPLQPLVQRELFLMCRRDRTPSPARRAFEEMVWRVLPQVRLHAAVELDAAPAPLN